LCLLWWIKQAHILTDSGQSYTSRLLSLVSLLQNLFLLPFCWYLILDGKIEHALYRYSLYIYFCFYSSTYLELNRYHLIFLDYKIMFHVIELKKKFKSIFVVSINLFSYIHLLFRAELDNKDKNLYQQLEQVLHENFLFDFHLNSFLMYLLNHF